MISSQINHFGVTVIHHLQHRLKKSRMLLFPGSIFFKLPAVNNIAVEDKLTAFVLFEEVGHFFGFGAGGSQMKVRDDNRAKM
jgi:hypothetical protein